MAYDLYGVVQHSGSLQGGHYVAYVKYTTEKDMEGESSNSNAANYGSWTVGKADDGEGDSAKGADHQPEDYGKAELGYQKSVKNASKRVGRQKIDTWCYTSDSYVTSASKEDVHDSQAYLLLYVQRC